MTPIVQTLVENVLLTIKENEFSKFKHRHTKYDPIKFNYAVVKCCGFAWENVTIKSFDEVTLIIFLEDVKYNSLNSLSEIAYIITCVANERY